MVAHPVVSEQDLQSSLKHISDQSLELWPRLTPHLQKQLAQHWARLVKQMQQQSILSKEGNDVQDQ